MTQDKIHRIHNLFEVILGGLELQRPEIVLEAMARLQNEIDTEVSGLELQT